MQLHDLDHSHMGDICALLNLLLNITLLPLTKHFTSHIKGLFVLYDMLQHFRPRLEDRCVTFKLINNLLRCCMEKLPKLQSGTSLSMRTPKFAILLVVCKDSNLLFPQRIRHMQIVKGGGRAAQFAKDAATNYATTKSHVLVMYR